MKYKIDRTETLSAYIQLYQQLKSDITHEILSFGSKLPSKRLLAEETGVSVITVQHAYSLLCAEGYIEAKERKGYYVIYKNSDFFTFEDTPTTADINKNTHHSHSSFPFSVLAKTMRKVLSDYGDDILIKSPNHGLSELRKAICAYLARSSGITVRPEQIIIGSGAEYLYSLIAQLFGKDAVFGLESPSYDKIRKVYSAAGITCDMLKLERNGIKSYELARTKASVLHVTPFNSHPTGFSADASKRYEYLRWAEKRNGYIIEDNYDCELTVSTKNEDTVFSLSKNGRVIYLNTFSRTVAPSIRVGYMALPENLLEEFEKKLGFYSCTVPVFEQYVLAQLLNSGDFERHINRVRRNRRKNL